MKAGVKPPHFVLGDSALFAKGLANFVFFIGLMSVERDSSLALEDFFFFVAFVVLEAVFLVPGNMLIALRAIFLKLTIIDVCACGYLSLILMMEREIGCHRI